MRSYIALAVFGFVLATSSLSAQQGVLQTAADALKVSTIKTLQVTGSGANFSVGQNYTSSEPWPRVTVKNYTAVINYDTGSMRTDLVRESGAVMPRGGGAPFFGEQRQTQLVSGNFAWNLGAPGPNGAAPMAAPAPDAAPERMLAIWTTPIGFVKGAMANNATTKGNTVSFTAGGKYKVEGTINKQGQVEKVRTWFDQPIVGDMLVETTYSGYKDFGGVTYPSRIVQTQDGYPALDITVSAVTANPAVTIDVPQNVRAFQPPPINVASQKMADGVYYLTGTSHHSLAIEMADYIVVVDTPLTQARGEAVLAKAKELIPGKPIRYVAMTHHHGDHIGGLRSFIAEGATVVTTQSNREVVEMMAAAPQLDRLAKNPRKPEFLFVERGKRVITDGSRTLELLNVGPNPHARDMVVAYLPKERVVFQGDLFFMPPNDAPVGPPQATTVSFAKKLQELKLGVDRIASVHGRTTTIEELNRALQSATPST